MSTDDTAGSTVVAGVDLVDPELARIVAAGLESVEKLMISELSDGEDFLTEAALHLAKAGGKRFRPLFTVLTGQLGPNRQTNPSSPPPPSSNWSTWPRFTTTM